MTLECLEAELRQALASLHDPGYTPSPLLRAIIGCDPDADDSACVRSAILQAVESLRPEPSAPPTSRACRIYEVLSYRYLQALTQEATAERLGITARHLRREQREAVLVLARRLLEQQEHLARGQQVAHTEMQPIPDLPAWRDQVRQELAALRQSAPDSVTEVTEALRGVIALEKARLTRSGVTVQMGDAQERFTVAIHPSLLRQVLMNVIGQLAEFAAGGTISVETWGDGDQVIIVFSGQPVTAGVTPDTCLIDEVLSAQEGKLTWSTGDDRLTFHFALPAADEVTVLVVDDNQDLVHFYRRYTAGSRYRIVHVPLGRNVMSIIEAQAPGVIVLDLMLPDMDGWELLTHLHEHPATRAVPVVVCSVIREADLALELGAVLYLPKPVRRAEFLAALEQALIAKHPLRMTTHPPVTAN